MKAAQQELPFRQWGGARKGAGRKRRAPERSASSAPGFPERRAARHAPHAPGSVEPPHAPVLPRAALGLCPRLRALRLPLGGVLHAGEPHPLHRRSPRCEDAVPRDEGPRGPDGAGAQQGHAPHGARVCRPLPRATSDFAAAVRERDPYVLANWIIHAERNGDPAPSGIDPYCSAASHNCGPPLVAGAQWWMLRVGVQRDKQAFAA